jgi:hypothetical protein
MKFTETITSTTITLLLTSLSGLFGILLGSIYSEIVPIILPTLTQQLPITVLLKILSVAIILFFLSVVLTIFVYLNYKPKYKARFGILWDKDKQAYCPSCKTLLSNYQPFVHSSVKTSYMYNCIKCDRMIPINDKGMPITLEDAIKKI